MSLGIEYEKKFLVEYPNLEEIMKYNPVKYEIEQYYLLSDFGSHRIRKRKENGEYTYIETVKIRINGSKAYEYEKIISSEKYEKLKLRANPKKHSIIKDRYTFLYEGKYLELDVFSFWKDKAILEIELKNEKDSYSIPEEIKVIKDVSDDKKYKNNHLASIPYEDY